MQILSRRVALSNSVWDVRLDDIRDVNGAEVSDYVSLAPRKPRADLISGVIVLPLVEQGIALLHSWRHVLERYVWEAPRGFVDPGEEPQAAAMRELVEETGLVCDAGDLIPLGHVLPEPSTIAGIGAIYLARNCRFAGGRQDNEPGLGALHVLPAYEVFAMQARWEIQEASTLAALCRYGELLKPQAVS